MTVRTKLNHVAMSMPAGELDQAARDDILAFYGEVFGWSEQRPEEEPGNPLILRVGGPTEFLYLYPQDGDGMQPRPTDHYGVEVRTEEELDEILEMARRHQRKDSRVQIVDKKVTHYAANGGGVDLISFYLRYLLPLMVEVQCFRWSAAKETTGAS